MMRRLPVLIILLLPVLFVSCSEGVISPYPGVPAGATIPPSSTPMLIPTTGSGCIPAYARRESVRVTKVIDGDSIEVEMGGVGFQVRYVGIDAPEMTGEPLAEEAWAANRSIVEGRQIVLIRDLAEADRYGRLLRYVFVDGVFANREMVRLGMAWARSYPPNSACDAELQSAEEEARQASLGVWEIRSPSGTQTPGLEAGGGCLGVCVTPPAGCVIKGNINLEGAKIYHVPEGRYYAGTRIEPERGEHWFCSEEEAVAAGWRRSKQ